MASRKFPNRKYPKLLHVDILYKWLNPWVRQLRDRAAQAQKEAHNSAVVGYDQRYALYVHEDLTMRHPRGGQAKFLTAPVYQYRDEIHEEIKKYMEKRISKRKGTAASIKDPVFTQALLRGAMFIRKMSLPLVPVDTGALKASAFTAVEQSHV